MGSHRCVTCGQPVSDQSASPSPEWLDLGNEDDPWADGAAQQDPASSRRPRLAVGALFGLVALVVAWRAISALAFGDSEPEDQATPVDDVIEEVAEPEPEVTVANFFRENVDQGSTRYAVALSRAGTIEVLSADGVATPELKTATTFAQVGQFPLFSDGEQTWGINPSNPNEVLVASANYRVVKTNASGGVAYMKPAANDETRVGVLMFGVWNSPEIRLSPADAVIPVDGVGVIVVPETGGSFLMANSTLEELTSANILDATSTSAVLRSCTETLECATLVARDINPATDLGELDAPDGPDLVEIEVAPGDSLAVSPDGQWIATWSRTGLRLLDPTTGESVRLITTPPDRVAWSPDSSFLTWTSTGRLQFTRIDAMGDDNPVRTLPLSEATSAQSLIVTSLTAS